MEREKRNKQTKKKEKSVILEGAAASSVSSSSQSDFRVQVIDLQTINSAELYVDPKINAFANISIDPIRQLCLAADKQVFISNLIQWTLLYLDYLELIFRSLYGHSRLSSFLSMVMVMSMVIL